MAKLENKNHEIAESKARTATLTTKDFRNIQHLGGHIIINVTDVTATGQITPKIEAKDAVTGIYYTLLVGSAITASGTVVMKIYPSATSVANLVANDILPLEYRVVITHLNAVAITYGIGINLV